MSGFGAQQDAGLLLDIVTRGRRELKRLLYLGGLVRR